MMANDDIVEDILTKEEFEKDSNYLKYKDYVLPMPAEDDEPRLFKSKTGYIFVFD